MISEKQFSRKTIKQRASQQGLFAFGLALLSPIMFAGCSLLPNGYADYDAGLKERGEASWYGDAFHGRLTASGKVYDQHKLTAAHRVLPLGSRVRVLNALNGRQVEVLINDRGPFIDGRIIDLSHAAAEALDMIDIGTSPVTIDVITYHRSADPRRALSGSAATHQRTRPMTTWAVPLSSAHGAFNYGDFWMAPGGPDRNDRISWRALRDVRNERRSRRLSELSDDLPLPAYPLSPLPDEQGLLPDTQSRPISV